MKRRSFAAGLVFGCAAAPAALAQQTPTLPALSEMNIHPLFVRMDDSDSEFEVIDARMDETATAAVFFGLIGAAINSADNNADDDASAAPLLETARSIDLGGLVHAAIIERLTQRQSIQLAQSPDLARGTLVVAIGEWGLVRRAQLPDRAMRGFLKLNLSVMDADGRRIWGPQREHSIGQMAAELPAFTPEVFRAEIEALAARAGRQVANRIIYG